LLYIVILVWFFNRTFWKHISVKAWRWNIANVFDFLRYNWLLVGLRKLFAHRLMVINLLLCWVQSNL